MNKEVVLKKINEKLDGECSELERIIYSEALESVTNDVNPHKTWNWIHNVIRTFNEKPKPLSEKEKQQLEKQKKKKEEKLLKKQQLKEKIELLNVKFREFLSNSGLMFIGFFDWKEFSEEESESLSKLVKKAGYFYSDEFNGDAYQPFITEKEIGDDFYNKIREFKDEYDELEGDADKVLDEYETTSVSDFRDKIIELV